MVQVSVILINYNSSEFTIKCVESINRETKDISYEIVIIDNCSSWAQYKMLSAAMQKNDHVKLYRSNINLGFSGGNMLGVQYARGNYLFFLNNDCELMNDNLSILHRFMQENPQAAVCTGQMHDADRKPHNSFAYTPSLSLQVFGNGLNRMMNPQAFPSKKKLYTNPLEVQMLTGASLFVDSQVFAELGGFDTQFFLYCEEEDLAMRMQQAGRKLYLVPEARFLHHMKQSTGQNYAIQREYFISLLYLYRKHFNRIGYHIMVTIQVFKNLKRIYRGLNYLRLAFFIFSGAPMKYSLRHQQKISFAEVD